MSDYRRAYVKGGCYFFTVVTAERRPILLTYIQLLREAFRVVRSSHPYTIDAAVILPDHLHCIWTLPEIDNDYSTRWRLLKSHFSRKMSEQTDKSFNKSNRGIWQNRFWEHLIRDEHDYNRHLDYIHYNPVKHGLVEKAANWEYSTFHKFVKQGFYEPGWSEPVDKNMDIE